MLNFLILVNKKTPLGRRKHKNKNDATSKKTSNYRKVFDQLPVHLQEGPEYFQQVKAPALEDQELSSVQPRKM